MARVSFVAYINLFGAYKLNAFGVQLGAQQIMNWCAPINYLKYLVRAITQLEIVILQPPVG